MVKCLVLFSIPFAFQVSGAELSFHPFTFSVPQWYHGVAFLLFMLLFYFVHIIECNKHYFHGQSDCMDEMIEILSRHLSPSPHADSDKAENKEQDSNKQEENYERINS